MMRFALLLWLVTLGALGLVACDDDGETATTETEVVTSDFAAGGRVAGALDPDACGDYDGRRPDGYHVRIQVLEGAVPCREAQRLLKNFYRGRYQPPWSCPGGQGEGLVKCRKPGVALAGHLYCPKSPEEALCHRFEAEALGPVDVAGGPDVCGDKRGRGPGGYRIRIDVLEGAVPCREAQRVLKNYYRGGNTPLWSCVGQGDRLVECEKPGVGAFAGHMQCRVWADHKAACLSRFGSP